MKNKVKISFIVIVFLLFVAILTLANNVLAQEKDSDLDGIPDETDRYPFDYDNDGMPDIWEHKHNLRYDEDDANEDPDGDGVSNIDEYMEGTDPLVSDKTEEKVRPTFLSPVEVAMARVLIWLGVGLFILLVVVSILHWTNVFDIFHFMQILRNKLFRREGVERAAIPGYAPARRPVLPGHLRTYPPRRPVLHPRYPTLPQREVKEQPKQKVFIPRSLKPPLRAVPAHPIKAEEVHRRVGEPVHTIEEKVPLKFFAYVEKDKDVFGKLSEHINDYKALKKDDGDSLRKLARI